QHEVVVAVDIDADQPAVTDGGRTAEELEDYTEARWWQVADLLSSSERFYPGRLPQLLPAFLPGPDPTRPFAPWTLGPRPALPSASGASAGTGELDGLGRPDDVDHEYERVVLLDSGTGVPARRAVTQRRRYDQHHPAADLHAGQALGPASEHIPAKLKPEQL